MARTHSHSSDDRVAIVGAGMAGLCAAARLAHAGVPVTVIERQAVTGGKIRSLATVAGPAAAGPTVLTLRPVFEALFSAVGERLEDHLRLIRQPVIARHFWPDGSRLDLHHTEGENLRAIRDFAGRRAEAEFLEFNRRAAALFNGFADCVIRAPCPSPSAIMRAVLRRPQLVEAMAPGSTLHGLLRRSFSDPRLAQLFGRYATYVGGSPYRSPALLALIWHAESAGVWAVAGGLQRLAGAIAELAAARGAEFRCATHVERINVKDGAATGITLDSGEVILARHVVFNGDPKALAEGALGQDCSRPARQVRRAARSLSANVWTFASRAAGPDLVHHNVFFRTDPEPEFAALDAGRRITNPTLYLCAMDRGLGSPPPMAERFEIIANAPAQPTSASEAQPCPTQIFETLARFGLTFDPRPERSSLTTPADFARMFPHSDGALYGQSPHGILSTFRRPTARTKIAGLYLAGGGTHPGPGMPMAALSGQHAAEAILHDRTSTSRFRPTDMPGGISMASTPQRPAQSASSGS